MYENALRTHRTPALPANASPTAMEEAQDMYHQADQERAVGWFIGDEQERCRTLLITTKRDSQQAEQREASHENSRSIAVVLQLILEYYY